LSDRGGSGPKIILGTSGFQYKDWVGSFYPAETKPQGMLAAYAQAFAAVELNFTYYGLPKAKNMTRMAETTPPGFEFIVKAHKTTTHEGRLDDVKPLLEGLAPVAEAGKLSGVLCQFPWAFKNKVESRRHLAGVAEGFVKASEELGLPAGVPLFIEFRHDSWMGKPVFDFLSKLGLLFVSVDEPDLEGLLPREGRLTGEAGYLRFHSRNARNWWGGGGKARYDYDYSDEEMSEWLPALRDMAERARKIFVFFNNCHRGQAARNAESMRGILRKAGLLG
jgi:uncharacterized protein YecE (DUF72 family)